MYVKASGGGMSLPDFLVVGAAKSGTTSLYSYLQQHPQIFMSKNKEPCFFSFAEAKEKDEDIFNRINIVSDFHKYLDLFKDAGDSRIAGEASTVYLYLYEETIKNIKKYHPHWKELKIIIIIRDPAERAFSHYLNDRAGGLLNFPFEEVIEKWKSRQLSKYYNYIDYGFYYNQIKSYKDTFDQVRVYLFENLEVNSKQLVHDLLEFLGVDSSFNIETSLKHNVSVGDKNKLLGKLIYKQNLLKELIKKFLPAGARTSIRNKILESFAHKSQLEGSNRKLLKEIYREDILKLQDLIHKDLTQWLT